ncbi:MAG: hypothetical protein PHW79_06130 [Candidatus Marinimicrobia bacterium]|nr:hypothetical protein [Candidatus Neomarinimicrobiota bacterium]
MQNFIGLLIGLFIIGGLFLIVGVFLLRWILNLNKIVTNQQAVISELQKIASQITASTQHLARLDYYEELNFKRVQAVQQQQARRTPAPATNKF